VFGVDTQGRPERKCSAWVRDTDSRLVLMGELCHADNVFRVELDIVVDLDPYIFA
jgi:hypothetical protein